MINKNLDCDRVTSLELPNGTSLPYTLSIWIYMETITEFNHSHGVVATGVAYKQQTLPPPPPPWASVLTWKYLYIPGHATFLKRISMLLPCPYFWHCHWLADQYVFDVYISADFEWLESKTLFSFVESFSLAQNQVKVIYIQWHV